MPSTSLLHACPYPVAGPCTRQRPASHRASLPRSAAHAPTSRHSLRSRQLRLVSVRAEKDATGDAPMSEDTLAEVLKRLEAAEAEASRLKADLAAAQKTTTESKSKDELAKMKPAPLATGLRTDGTTARLGGVPAGSKGKESSWLTEEDITFYTRGGATEAEKLGEAAVSAEAQSTVTRRILIGTGLTAVFGVLALQPDSALRGGSKKPLFFYLVAVLRALLPEVEEIVADARWEDLSIARKRILGDPNNLKENLIGAAAALEDPVKAQKAKDLAQAIIEYVAQADYVAYFDTVGKPTGAENARFADFSTKAVRAADAKIGEFLRLMPAEDVEAAQTQLAPPPLADAGAGESEF